MIFLGHQRDTNQLYRSCDCLISASRFEGLPFNVMEAIYCGLEVIVSDVKGNRDLAESCGGTVYPYGDAPTLAALMQRAERSTALGSSDGKFLLENVFEENLKLLEIS